MPIKKSAMKALRQSNKRAKRNLVVKDTLSYLRRMTRKAIDGNETSNAQDLAKQTIKSVDKAIQNNVIKKNTGSRIKSRLMKRINALGAK